MASMPAAARPAFSSLQEPAEKPWPPPGVTRVTPGIVAPRAVASVKPRYTQEALKAGISGTVLMEVVVGSDGQVGEVRVTRSLDREFGLDDRAVETVKKWRFTPARKDGVAVPVLVEIEMTFTLRK